MTRFDFSASGAVLKAGIISDTHGHIDDRIVEKIRDCDLLIHAGDICHGRVLEQMQGLCHHVVAVAGNNDRASIWPPEQREMVTALPQAAAVTLPGGELRIEHGHRHGMKKPCLKSLRQAHGRARAIVFGHTHELLLDRELIPWLINPGAAGQVGTNGGPSCAILHASMHDWHVELARMTNQHSRGKTHEFEITTA